eukprot:10037555-Karenia_brevis.AAC.1
MPSPYITITDAGRVMVLGLGVMMIQRYESSDSSSSDCIKGGHDAPPLFSSGPYSSQGLTYRSVMVHTGTIGSCSMA